MSRYAEFKRAAALERTFRNCGRSAAQAAAAAADLPGAAGIEVDVRDESSVARAVDQAWSRLGGIGMLVNNAWIGIHPRNPPLPTPPHALRAVPPPRLPPVHRAQ